jgi:hypothetical protein
VVNLGNPVRRPSTFPRRRGSSRNASLVSAWPVRSRPDSPATLADILFAFPTARFNVECKIEEDDASETGLRQYVAQPIEYQNTNPSFAVLLVLDKTVGAERAVNLFDSVWIEKVQREGEREPCRVLIIRVPGSRDNPNQLRPAP